MAFKIRCPYCQERLKVPRKMAGRLVRCHDCDGVLRVPDQEGDGSLAVAAPQVDLEERSKPNEHVKEYVRDLERRARQEARRKPYDRGQVPVALIAGLVLIGIGVVIMLTGVAAASRYGMFVTLINAFLLPMIFFIVGAMCLFVWRSK